MDKIILLLISIISWNSLAEDKIVVISMSEFPPYEFIEEGKIQGINYDTVSEVFRRAGYKTEFLPLPWKRALKLTESGDIDAVFSIKKSDYRKDQFIFSDPIMYTQDYFFKRKDFNIDVKDLDDLKPYKIAIVDKYFYGNKINKDNFPNLSPITSSIPEADNLRRLRAGRVDLSLCSIRTCNYWIQKYSKLFSNIDYIKSPAANSVKSLHIAFSRKDLARSNEIVQRFNEELAKYIAEGGTKRNISKYAPDSTLGIIAAE